VARALIVGCGCRGRLVARELDGRGWVVRGTSRSPAAAGEIKAAGAEFALADPDRVDTVLDHVGDVAVVVWLFASAAGSPGAVAALHGPRLERLLEELVDTPVRGFVYEAAGTAPPHLLEEGRAIVAAANERWRIPVKLMDTPPADHEQWLAATLAAVDSLVAAS
jgi:uncharacterized protein YbjT (DUF2867 family)